MSYLAYIYVLLILSLMNETPHVYLAIEFCVLLLIRVVFFRNLSV